MKRRRLLRILLFLVVTQLVISALLAWTPQGRAGTRAGFFVTQVVPAIPVKPQTWFTPDPVVESVQFQVPRHGPVATYHTGSLYRPPGEGPHPAILLFLGVAPAGADDPRVVNLGEALARSGLVAMFYWSPDMAFERMIPEDVGSVIEAFKYLRGRPEVDPQRVGIAGFCVGASYALVAASAAEIREDVRYVNAFGPYYDLRGLAVSLSSRSQEIDGAREPWTPGTLAERVFTGQMIAGVSNEAERAWLEGAATERLAPPEPFSTEAEAVYRLLKGLSPEEAAATVPNLPPATLADMDAVSPRDQISPIKARVLLMHDRLDRNLPAQDSRLLAAALEAEGKDLYYTEFAFFEHMDPTREVGRLTLIKEAWRLFLHIYNLMRAAF